MVGPTRLKYDIADMELQFREAFKNDLQETYGIFHMFADKHMENLQLLSCGSNLTTPNVCLLVHLIC